MEAGSQFAPNAVPGLTLRGSANYNRTRYAEFIAPCYTGETPGQGSTLTAYSGTTAQDLASKTSNNVPRWVAALGMLHRTNVGKDWDIEFGVDGRYGGSYLANAFVAPPVRLTRKDDLWQVAVIGKNLTNSFVVTGAQNVPLTGSNTGKANGVQSDQHSFAVMPRAVALQVT